VARQGTGKRGGYRVIVFFKSAMRSFVIYGFGKSDMDNISQKELAKLKKQAKNRFSMTEAQIEEALEIGILNEIGE
jgi:hypothetical protein